MDPIQVKVNQLTAAGINLQASLQRSYAAAIVGDVKGMENARHEAKDYVDLICDMQRELIVLQQQIR